MIALLVAVVVSLLDPQVGELAARAKIAAPAYLTAADAHAHALAAVISGHATDTDPALLMALAYQESRYTPATVTPEVGGKVSCGVMTPVPSAACAPSSRTVLGGYLAGAAHLRTWLGVTGGDLRRALLGYAGGYHLLAVCQDGHASHACNTPARLEAYARRLRSVPAS